MFFVSNSFLDIAAVHIWRFEGGLDT